MSFLSLRVVARFCYKSTSTNVPRFLYHPFLLHRGSYFQASLISRCCSSVSGDSQSESAKEKESRSGIYVALDSVVKIFSYSKEPNILKPWQTTEKESSGSGFAISGRKILTNAHVVDDHAYVQVKRYGSPKKYKAKVEAFGYECDLATLVIDSEEFWEDLNPLELDILGDIPSIGDTVFALGYPRGGEAISVTKGVVSRVEPKSYSHSSSNIELLTIQIDAAINDGNSGSPVVMGNKVVGIAFEHSSSQKMNYMIPTPVIKHFLSSVEETGQYIGLCSLDITYQHMEDAQLRKHFKMSPEMTGVLINEINPLSCAQGILKKDDVILAIDGASIENDETIPFRNKERISFTYLVPLKKPGETVLLKVLRKGREHEFNISLRRVQPLVPSKYLPSYYIFAGFVFMSLSKPYINGSSNICECASQRKATKAGEQIVIISQVLSNDRNIEYRDFEDFQVKKVNRKEVLNLRHLTELVEKCCTGDLRLDLENEKVIVVNYKSAKEATSLILEHHGIRSAMSKDLINKETSELASSAAA